MMRVLCLSGYSHPSHHRKIELLADAPDLELLHILQPGNGKVSGSYLSANSKRQYRVQVVPIRSLSRPGDPHRTIHWPPSFGLHQFKPDIIHCEHEQESLMAAEVALARAISMPGTPLILYSWQNILRRRSLPVWLVSRFTLWAARHIVCASQEATTVLYRQGFAGIAGSTSVAPLIGLDVRHFHPKPVPELRQKLQLDGFVVGYAGRLVPEKGIDTLLKAVARLKNPIQLLIVGDGPEKDNLQALAATLEIADRCRFVAGVPHDDMVNYLNLLNVLVLPSRTTPRWKEQYGRVLVEAMACKVVVVGANSGAIPEVIGDAECVFLEDNAADLANILDKLIGNSAWCSMLAEHAYQRATTKFVVENIAADLLETWRTLYREGKGVHGASQLRYPS